MFSMGNSINPFLHLTSNFLPSSPFMPQNENNMISLPQQNHEIILKPKKKTKRKDRHSKIYTAHGLRDRRVRLSIDISREFFKLQDILGFDKASHTISWLLKNSESSIRELNQKQGAKENSSENISPISKLCEGELGRSVKNTFAEKKVKTVNKQFRASIYGLRRESRAKARARARERTREKIMSSKKLDELNPSIFIQSNNLREIEVCEGNVGDVMNGSPSNLRFENSHITHKDWGKNLFADYEVFSKYFEDCNC